MLLGLAPPSTRSSAIAARITHPLTISTSSTGSAIMHGRAAGSIPSAAILCRTYPV